MKRRDVLKAAGAGFAASIAKPAIAQSVPEIRWRLTSSFPKSLDTAYAAAETLSKFVAEATDSKFQIQPFAAGEIIPPFQAIDAVGNNEVEMCHTAAYYFIDKDPTFALYTSLPFGLNSRQQNAWFFEGEGMKMLNEFGEKFNLYGLPGGSTGAQMGGWFRREINEVADLKGLKFRIGGWASKTISKLGGIPQQLPGGEIYSALEKGTIDAAEWIGPYDDEKLGFYKVAKFYYYPGWWEGNSTNHFFINTGKWSELPKNYQTILTAAAGYVNVEAQAKYDARNPAALKRLIAAGTQLRPFSQAIMEAGLKASIEVNDETSAASSDFKKIYDALIAFRNNEYLWWRIAEYNYDSFMIRSIAS